MSRRTGKKTIGQEIIADLTDLAESMERGEPRDSKECVHGHPNGGVPALGRPACPVIGPDGRVPAERLAQGPKSPDGIDRAGR